MGNITYIGGTGIPHRRFEDEFLTHRGCSEWWYVTGHLEDGDGKLYSFQFTLARIKLAGVPFHMLLTAVTEMATGKHRYAQRHSFFSRHVITNLHETSFGSLAGIRYAPNEKSPLGRMELSIREEDYTLSLEMRADKPPVWHCEDGKLRMGILSDPRQATYYWSMTSLSAEGTLVLGGREMKVRGRAWFDRQGGPCRLTNPLTNWEWFSFRFFDGEEIMLFSFPRTGYTDGTLIRADGSSRRLNDYRIEPLGYITEPATGYVFSKGWRVTLPDVKAGEYLVTPVAYCQLNLFFYELLAEVTDSAGARSGYCVVELLPGARNKRIKPLLALKKSR